MDFRKELNESQYKAVVETEGPMMVIAGAGSGKTRVLTFKIAYLLKNNIDPFNILALTFTNKAAREMRDRVEKIVNGSEAKSVWMGTFHSVFARLLRKDGNLLGYNPNYSIYDTEDSKKLLKNIVKDFKLDTKLYDSKTLLNRISAVKSNLISAKEYLETPEYLELDKTYQRPEIGRIYQEYQLQLFRSNAMDFDDILFNFYLLIKNFPEVLQKYQNQFKYILIDEFQDTNKAQYLIIKLLSKPENNLCVVGDDAQSIYAFRGANIENILGFTKDFPNHKVFKLEQNYRSTNHIVQISNSIISKNTKQIKKKLWTDNNDGEKIKIIKAITDSDEATKVVGSIFERKMNYHLNNKDFAILYRTNAQSRVLEDQLRKMNIDYQIFGGLSFYQRKEIKDVLAYFRVIINQNDIEALNRIINYPTRGIGTTSMMRVQNKATEKQITVWEVLNDFELLREANLNSGIIKRIGDFVSMIIYFNNKLNTTPANKLAREIVNKSGLIKQLNDSNSPDEVARIENIEELINAISDACEKKETLIAVENEGILDDDIFTLDMYMQDVALLTDRDSEDNTNKDCVQLMTIHSAKGLEFKNVYVVGLEENLFPSQLSLFSKEDLEEERRLFYVACTRAEENLTISYAENRYQWGIIQPTDPSRFLRDLDYNYVENAPNLRKSGFGISSIHGFSTDSGPKIKSGNKRISNVINDFSRSDNNSNIVNFSNSNTKRNLKPISSLNNIHDNIQSISIKINDLVEHDKFGKGKVIAIEGVGGNKKAHIIFNDIGKKVLYLQYAKLKVINS
ncbi:MAG: ATP-dependent helicase [Bacteroidales bacterium]